MERFVLAATSIRARPRASLASGSWLGFWHVMESVMLGALAGVEAIIPLQLISQALFILRIMLLRGIRIGAHAMERHIGHGVGTALVKIHVFHKAVGVEEVIAFPTRRKWGQ